MGKIEIHKDKCKGCGLCIIYCPKKLIAEDATLNKRGIKAAKFNGSNECSGCCFCAIICPDNCIAVYK